jgi:hypothetical protein
VLVTCAGVGSAVGVNSAVADGVACVAVVSAEFGGDSGSLVIACSGGTVSVATDVAAGPAACLVPVAAGLGSGAVPVAGDVAAGACAVANVGDVGTTGSLAVVAACLLPPLAAPIMPSTTIMSMTVSILWRFIQAFTCRTMGNCEAAVNTVHGRVKCLTVSWETV